MSLIVAKIIRGSVRILSDTKLGHNSGLRLGPLQGTLKSIIVNSKLCVSFSGNSIALNVIRQIDRNTEYSVKNLDAILSLLYASHCEGGRNKDYLVALAGPPPSLHRISNGNVEKDILNAWIGDQAAFEAYQACYHSLSQNKFAQEHSDETSPLETYGRMSDAFRAVIADPQISSVDHFLLTATSFSSAMSGFHFLPSMVGFDFLPVNTSGEISLIRPSGTAEGGYNYTILVPSVVGIGIVGVYILQNQLGVLFYPMRFDEAKLYKNTQIDYFVTCVYLDFGFWLDGVRFG